MAICCASASLCCVRLTFFSSFSICAPLLQVRDIITGEADQHPVVRQHVHDTDWHGVEFANGAHHHHAVAQELSTSSLTLISENQDAPKILVNGQELEVASLNSKGEMTPGKHLVQLLDRSGSAAIELLQEGHGPDEGPVNQGQDDRPEQEHSR